VFGFQVINVFFDLPRAAAKQGLEFLKKRPEVLWLTQNVGPRTYETTFRVRDLGEYSRLINRLGAETGIHFRDPIVTIESESRYWGLRFLAERYQDEQPVCFTYTADVRELDSVDEKILRFLQRSGGAAVRDMARSIGIAQTTATYRLERLREWGALSEDIFFSSVEHDFVQAQLVLNLKARSAQHDRSVVDMCSNEPYVEGLITGLGCWDYNVILRADTVSRLVEVEESLLGALGRNLARSVMYVRNRLLLARAEYSTGIE
jgi:DNA-binding Lrp family transcriptional regulator